MLIKTEPIPLRTVATWVSQGPQHHPGPFFDLPIIQRLKGTAGGLQASAPAPVSICSDELVTVPTVKCHPWQRTLLWWDLGRLVSVWELGLVPLTWRVFTRQSWARPHLHGAPSPGWKPLKDQTHLAAQHWPQGKGRGGGCSGQAVVSKVGSYCSHIIPHTTGKSLHCEGTGPLQRGHWSDGLTAIPSSQKPALAPSYSSYQISIL